MVNYDNWQRKTLYMYNQSIKFINISSPTPVFVDGLREGGIIDWLILINW